jgi:hypothetical protein
MATVKMTEGKHEDKFRGNSEDDRLIEDKFREVNDRKQ